MSNPCNVTRESDLPGTDSIFVFVVWSKARSFDDVIKAEISSRFEIIRDFEITWPRRFFADNLAAFYGWKSWHVWRNKARKCGTGPFRVFVIKDAAPVWSWDHDTYGHNLLVDVNVSRLKKEFRALTGHSNVVHSSVTADETAHQLAVLGCSSDAPIPFRKLRYPDDDRIRSVRRRVWLGIVLDIMVPLVASVVAGIAVWLDFHVLGMSCTERGFVEWSGLLLAAACGALMTVCALLLKPGRGAHAIMAAFFFDLAIREADYVLDSVFDSSVWRWTLAIVTVSFAIVTVRFGKTVYPGFRSMRRSRRFPLFACGVALLLFISQFLGRAEIWQSIAVENYRELSRSVEECVELFGYALMFSWALPHALRTILRR